MSTAISTVLVLLFVLATSCSLVVDSKGIMQKSNDLFANNGDHSLTPIKRNLNGEQMEPNRKTFESVFVEDQYASDESKNPEQQYLSSNVRTKIYPRSVLRRIRDLTDALMESKRAARSHIETRSSKNIYEAPRSDSRRVHFIPADGWILG